VVDRRLMLVGLLYLCWSETSPQTQSELQRVATAWWAVSDCRQRLVLSVAYLHRHRRRCLSLTTRPSMMALQNVLQIV
jgi:hypothetical protein